MPEIPNIHAAVMMGITLFALVLFSREKVPLETSSLGILAVIVFIFSVFPFSLHGHEVESISFFSGFGHEALIAVAALMVCGQGLVVTGALVPVGRWIARLWQISPTLSLLATLLAGAVGSAFVNNTPIVVLLIPILTNVAARNNLSASPLLMPMNFSTLLGGAGTSIGTSTNLLVVAVAVDLGLSRFGMFDFVVPALIAAAVGILYLWLVAPRLLASAAPTSKAGLGRDFIYQITFAEGSASIGKTLSELKAQADGNLHVLRIRKDETSTSLAGTAPLPDIVIQAGNRVTGRGTADEINALEQALDAELIGHTHVAGAHDVNNERADGEEEGEDIELAQVVVMENSPLVGRTLASSHFLVSYGIDVIGIHRAKQNLRRLPQGITKVSIETGDILLIEGLKDNVEEIKSQRGLLVLDERLEVVKGNHGWIAGTILLGVVGVAALGILPIAVSAVCGVLLMLLTRCLDWSDVGSALSIPVIMIVVVSLALGSALTQTGATEYIAQVFLYGFGGASPMVILSALILMMAIMTNIVSNNAAAVIGTPIAVSLAQQLGAPPETFVLAVLFGANLSFVTPMAYKTNVLVMSAGSYSFSDFVKVGLPLAVILWITYSLVLPALYGI
jgi:di/tricarboxylate transporter